MKFYASYLNSVIVTRRHQHLRVCAIEGHAVHHIAVLILGQADAVVPIPEVGVHVLSAAVKQ